jgi:hypothetical protein
MHPGLPKRCAAALTEVDEAKAKSPHIQQIQIIRTHTLHRMITMKDYNEGVLSSLIFDQHDCSLYAEGEGLGELKLAIVENLKPQWIGSVSFSASIILDEPERFKLILLHDPFPDPNGTVHPNHVRMICTKNSGNMQPLVKNACVHLKQ